MRATLYKWLYLLILLQSVLRLVVISTMGRPSYFAFMQYCIKIEKNGFSLFNKWNLPIQSWWNTEAFAFTFETFDEVKCVRGCVLSC